jgi:hypothetical protein
MGSTSVAYAIEQNGNTAVPIGTRVVLYPIGGGRYRFQLGSCSQNSMSGTKPPIPADVAGPTVLASAAIAGTQAAAAGAAEVSSLTPYTGTAISQPMPGL